MGREKWVSVIKEAKALRRPLGQGASKVRVTYSNGCLRFLDIVTLRNHISKFEICKEKHIFLKRIKSKLDHSWNFHVKKIVLL